MSAIEGTLATPIELKYRTFAGRRPARLPAWLRAFLRVPLLAKLAGANGLLLLSIAAVAFYAHRTGDFDRWEAPIIAAFVLGLAVNMLLVYLALRPLALLERTAEQVWRGDLGARVPDSALADRDMQRVGRTLNLVLDNLVAERSRLRQFATHAIQAGEAERSRISRELHDTTAQHLAALMYQASAAAQECTDPSGGQRLAELKESLSALLDEVRELSNSVHPRVLEDLGLQAALRRLAREASQRSGIEVELDTDGVAAPIPIAASWVLYRVAQEAVANAVRHAEPAHVFVRLAADQSVTTLEVVDDGRGFDTADDEASQGLGLFTMRERVALADGRIEVQSAAGRGTRVTARVPQPR